MNSRRPALGDARAYHRRKRIFRRTGFVIEAVFFLFFTFTRGEPLLGVVEAMSLPDFWRQAVFLAFFYALLQIVLWPLRCLSGWRLEKKFGMSKQSFTGWFADTLKAQGLGVLIFVAGALVFFSTLRAYPGQWWWILAWITFAFSAFFLTIFPVLILPLFYRCPPLKEEALAVRLQKTLQRCGLPRLPLYEIRLGEKTVRANAMIAGLGKTRRALLSDTLLAQYEPGEIEMVLAHEAGHAVRRHLVRSLVFEAVTAGAAFYALFRFSSRFDLSSLGFFSALMLAAHLAGIAIRPLANALSRLHEKEADRFALERYPDLAVFTSLMEKLALHNLSDPSPGKWEEFFHYTHPSKKNRIAHAEKFLGKPLPIPSAPTRMGRVG